MTVVMGTAFKAVSEEKGLTCVPGFFRGGR
jgi:hypothetical protein